MASLPQSADEFLTWLISFLPEALQPYAGFVFTLIVVLVGVIAFFQPIVRFFKKPEEPSPSTGDPAIDALLTLDARGKLGAPDRSQLTMLLLGRITQPAGASGGMAPMTAQSQRAVLDEVVNATPSPQKSATLEALLTDPVRAVDHMMETAKSATDYVHAGVLALGFDAAKSRAAFERALALEPDQLDASYHLLRLRSLTEGPVAVQSDFEQLLARAEKRRPDLAALTLLQLARQANVEDRWQEAQSQYQRAIQLAEATHDAELLIAACHAAAAELWQERPLRRRAPDEVPEWLLEQIEAMLDQAAAALTRSDGEFPLEELNQLLGRAQLAQIRSRFDESATLLEEARERARQLGSKTAEARVLALLAIVQHKTHKRFDAIDSVDEAMALMSSVLQGSSIDADIANADLLRLKGQLLLDNAQFDEALESLSRSRAAFQVSGALDELGMEGLARDIQHCRIQGSDEYSEQDMLLEREGLEDFEATEEEGDGGAQLDEPLFDEDEGDKLDQAARLFVAGQNHFENENWAEARAVLEQSKKLFEEIHALAPDTEEDIDRMLEACSARGA
jgi:hypothetical protein